MIKYIKLFMTERMKLSTSKFSLIWTTTSVKTISIWLTFNLKSYTTRCKPWINSCLTLMMLRTCWVPSDSSNQLLPNKWINALIELSMKELYSTLAKLQSWWRRDFHCMVFTIYMMKSSAMESKCVLKCISKMKNWSSCSKPWLKGASGDPHARDKSPSESKEEKLKLSSNYN